MSSSSSSSSAEGCGDGPRSTVVFVAAAPRTKSVTSPLAKLGVGDNDKGGVHKRKRGSVGYDDEDTNASLKTRRASSTSSGHGAINLFARKTTSSSSSSSSATSSLAARLPLSSSAAIGRRSGLAKVTWGNSLRSSSSSHHHGKTMSKDRGKDHVSDDAEDSGANRRQNLNGDDDEENEDNNDDVAGQDAGSGGDDDDNNDNDDSGSGGRRRSTSGNGGRSGGNGGGSRQSTRRAETKRYLCTACSKDWARKMWAAGHEQECTKLKSLASLEKNLIVDLQTTEQTREWKKRLNACRERGGNLRILLTELQSKRLRLTEEEQTSIRQKLSNKGKRAAKSKSGRMASAVSGGAV